MLLISRRGSFVDPPCIVVPPRIVVPENTVPSRGAPASTPGSSARRAHPRSRLLFHSRKLSSPMSTAATAAVTPTPTPAAPPGVSPLGAALQLLLLGSGVAVTKPVTVAVIVTVAIGVAPVLPAEVEEEGLASAARTCALGCHSVGLSRLAAQCQLRSRDRFIALHGTLTSAVVEGDGVAYGRVREPQPRQARVAAVAAAGAHVEGDFDGRRGAARDAADLTVYCERCLEISENASRTTVDEKREGNALHIMFTIGSRSGGAQRSSMVSPRFTGPKAAETLSGRVAAPGGGKIHVCASRLAMARGGKRSRSTRRC